MKPRRPLRMSLLSSMILVALAAAWLGWAAAERRGRISSLNIDYQRQEDRLRWAERMQGRGYVSKATLLSERAKMETIRSELTDLGAAPEEE